MPRPRRQASVTYVPKMRKIIFLDIDGVLNDAACLNKASKLGGEAKWLAMLSPLLISRLNTLVEKTGAEIVISSTWRLCHSFDRLVELLTRQGLVASVIGVTPSLYKSRGDDIQQWLTDNPEPTTFVILDDDADMWHLSNRLVKTETRRGLTEEACDVAVEMLNV